MPDPLRFQTTGAVLPGRAIYVSRPADREFHDGLAAGEFCYVLSARQMGKSSLLAHTVHSLRAESILVATANVQAATKVESEEAWYEGVIDQLVTSAAENPDWLPPFDPADWGQHWDRQRGPHGQRFLNFIRDAFLAASERRWVIAVDEIDATISQPFSDGFFAAIRLAHDYRAAQPIFERLAFALLGVATPDSLIRDPTRTPFNIGRRVELDYLTEQDCAPLADALPAGSWKVEALRHVLGWTAGQPHLTQEICSELAAHWRHEPPRDMSSVERAIDAFVERRYLSPLTRFSTNLDYIAKKRVESYPDKTRLLRTYLKALREDGLTDETRSPVLAELKISGLLRAGKDGRLRVANSIYARVFDVAWVKAALPRNAAVRWSVASSVVAVLLVIGFLVSLRQQRANEVRGLLAALMEARDDVPTEAYARLSDLVQDKSTADEAMAAYWDRAALRVEVGGSRDEAGVLRLKALSVRPTPGRELAAHAAVDPETRQFLLAFRHQGPVRSAQFSADGTRVVTASGDRTARVWESGTGKLVATLAGHENAVTSAQFSADGTRVVTASADGTARVWESGTGKLVATLAGHENAVMSAQFSADGTRVVMASGDRTARVWESGTGKLVATLAGHEGPVTSAQFSADGTRVVTASFDRTALVWESGTGKLVTTLTGHEGAVMSAQFSADGTRVVTASLNRTARVWESGTGKLVTTLAGHEYAVMSAQFSADGTRVVTVSFDRIVLWDTSGAGAVAVEWQMGPSLFSHSICFPKGQPYPIIAQRQSDGAFRARTLFGPSPAGSKVQFPNPKAALADYLRRTGLRFVDPGKSPKLQPRYSGIRQGGEE